METRIYINKDHTHQKPKLVCIFGHEIGLEKQKTKSGIDDCAFRSNMNNVAEDTSDSE